MLKLYVITISLLLLCPKNHRIIGNILNGRRQPMKEKIVSDVMKPLSEYRVISAESNLFQAAQALDQVQKAFEQNPQVHKILLISDDKLLLVGYFADDPCQVLAH